MYQEMTVDRWMSQVREHNGKLRDLVASYHPSARRPAAYQKEALLLADGDVVEMDAQPMAITAPNAEMACREVRRKIRQEQPDDPLTRWDKAVDASNVGEIMSLLNGAWFGVPESTGCWNIRGFSEAVDLLDDPPDWDKA